MKKALYKQKCTVRGCKERQHARGYCDKHYSRFKKHGDPVKTLYPGRDGKPRDYLSYTKEDKSQENPYRYVFKPDHPNAAKNGYMGEHRFVMSEMLGRALLKGENVHHKNGIRADNRPENLELWVTYQPCGQKPEDLVKWAKEILRRYDDVEEKARRQ